MNDHPVTSIEARSAARYSAPVVSVSDLIGKLVEMNDMADVSFFQMPGPVCLHNDRPFTAKSRQMRTTASFEGIEKLYGTSALDMASKMKALLLAQLAYEVIQEVVAARALDHSLGNIDVGILDLIENDVDFGRSVEFVLRYAIGPCDQP